MAKRIIGNLVYGHFEGQQRSFIPFRCPDLQGYREVIPLGYAAYQEWVAAGQPTLTRTYLPRLILLLCGWVCAVVAYSVVPRSDGLGGVVPFVVTIVIAVICFLGFSRSMDTLQVRADARDAAMKDVVIRYSNRDDVPLESLDAWEVVAEGEQLFVISPIAVQPEFPGC